MPPGLWIYIRPFMPVMTWPLHTSGGLSWVTFKKQVFKGWDKGMANENISRHTGGAIVLDGIGYLDQYMAEDPEDFLEYCDWMGIPMQAYPVALNRFIMLISKSAQNLAP